MLTSLPAGAERKRSGCADYGTEVRTVPLGSSELGVVSKRKLQTKYQSTRHVPFTLNGSFMDQV